MNSALVPTLPLIEGEALSGYVSRTAKLYETTPRDFCSDLGMKWPALCTGHENQINRLSWLLGVPVKSLKDHTICKLTQGRYQIGRTHATIGVLRRTSGRLCPKCVASALDSSGAMGLFHQLEWSVSCVHVCFVHRCPLIQLPSSADSHSAYDFVSRVLQNKSLIIKAAEASATLPDTPFEAYVRELVRQGSKQDWLGELGITHFHRACLTLGATLSRCPSDPLLELPREEARALCDLGFRHLRKGPSGLHYALQKSFHKDRSKRPYVCSDMGPFYRWLHSVHTDPVLSDLVDTTRQHIFETYPASLDKEVFGRKPRRRQLYTMADVRIRTGLGTAFIKTLLGYLCGQTEDEAIKRNDVTAGELKSVMDFWQSIAKLNEAASLLGVLPEQVKKLQKLHVLKTIKITSTLRYVERDQIDCILTKVDKLPPADAGSSSVSLMRFCRSNRLAIERVVQFWLNDENKVGFYRGDGQGLHQIKVNPNLEITREDTILHGDLTVMEAARFLKINVHAVRKLRDAGYLDEIRRRNSDTNHFKGFITKASIQKFQEKFITIGLGAEQLKMLPNLLAQRLDERGFETIDCKSGFVRVYAISEWAKIKQSLGSSASVC